MGIWLHYNWLSQEPEWLEFLRHGVEFMKKFSLDKNGRSWGALTRDGKPLALAVDVYHDLYTAQAFTQAAKATGETLTVRSRTQACVSHCRNYLQSAPEPIPSLLF